MNAVPLCIPVHEILYFSVDFHIIVGHYIPDQSFEPELVEQVLRNFKLIHSVLDANNLKRLNAVVMLQNKLGDCIISLGWTQLLDFCTRCYHHKETCPGLLFRWQIYRREQRSWAHLRVSGVKSNQMLNRHQVNLTLLPSNHLRASTTVMTEILI